MSGSDSYRLDADEPLADGVRRIARGRLDHAVDELDGSAGSTPSDAVHNARKDIKRMRALLRLVRGALGTEVYRRENARLRDAAAELAGRRDADVMVATLDGLGLGDAHTGPLRRALESHRLRSGAGETGSASARPIAMLGEVRLAVTDWPLEQAAGFQALAPGLERMYRRGRREFGEARETPTVEALHEWRKRVKELWYDHQVLDFVWPPLMAAVAAEAHELSDRLGDDHDLAVLLAWAQEHANPSAELVLTVEERREALQAEALGLGARLYADRPRAFMRRLERLWDAAERRRQPA